MTSAKIKTYIPSTIISFAIYIQFLVKPRLLTSSSRSILASVWLRDRLFEQKPKLLPVPVAPTREFCALFKANLEATIRDIGDMSGWEDDNNTVGPTAAAAKQSLLRLIPRMLHLESNQRHLYRLVLEHGDFGIHNISITIDANSQPVVASLYDW